MFCRTLFQLILLTKHKSVRGEGDLDNAAAVAAAKSLDTYFKEHVENALARIDINQNNNNK